MYIWHNFHGNKYILTENILAGLILSTSGGLEKCLGAGVTILQNCHPLEFELRGRQNCKSEAVGGVPDHRNAPRDQGNALGASQHNSVCREPCATARCERQCPLGEMTGEPWCLLQIWQLGTIFQK